MPAAKLRPVWPEHDDDAAGHVFAAVVADAFDNGNGAGVAHGKAFARHAAEVALAADRAVQHGVADDDRVFGNDPDSSGGRTTMRPPDRPLPT
jgi:Ca2+-binding RTX toxin-like protein